jgi:hypothetical protein
MRTLLWAVLSLCFCLSVVDALSQDAANQAPRNTQAAALTVASRTPLWLLSG